MLFMNYNPQTSQVESKLVKYIFLLSSVTAFSLGFLIIFGLGKGG